MVEQFITLTKHYSSSDRFGKDILFRHSYVAETFNFSLNWWRENTSGHEVVAAFVVLLIVGNVCPSVIFICKSLSCRVSKHTCHCITTGLISATVTSCLQTTGKIYALALYPQQLIAGFSFYISVYIFYI